MYMEGSERERERERQILGLALSLALARQGPWYFPPKAMVIFMVPHSSRVLAPRHQEVEQFPLPLNLSRLLWLLTKDEMVSAWAFSLSGHSLLKPSCGASVKGPTSAQVTISRFVSSSPASGSVLTAGSLEPALDCVSLPLCPSPIHTHTLSLSKINKH